MKATVIDRLRDLARKQPGRTAVIDTKTGQHRSYRTLDVMSDRVADELQRAGIGTGMRTVLMVPPGVELFILAFALFKARAIMVAVDPGLGIKRLGRCLGDAKPQAFIGSGTATLAQRLRGWGRETITTTLVADQRHWTRLFFPAAWRALPSLRHNGIDHESGRGAQSPDINDTAAILFTSGSTGTPKGVVYTHAHFAAQIDALQTQYAILSGEVDIGTFPLFALFASALGTTVVLPDMNFTRPARINAAHIRRLLDRHRVDSIFASPALLDRVTRFAERRHIILPIHKRVLSAGAPVATKILRRCVQVLPATTDIYTAYGATEALPISTVNAREILARHATQTARGMGVCVGRPLAGVTVRIIAIRNTRLASLADVRACTNGEIGEIIVQGAQVTARYYDKPDATAAAKINDTAGGFYHRTGDAGYLDAHGRLWFCGRVAERVVTAAGCLFTACCEGVFDAHPAVARCALVGVGDAGQDHPLPVICVELEMARRRSDRGAITAELRDLAGQFSPTHSIRHFLYHPALPVDIRHNAKINRHALARWAWRRLA